MQDLYKSSLYNLRKPLLVFFLVLFLSSFIVLADVDEIFVTGILRNATNNSLIEDTLNILINITNNSDGQVIYSQTQNNIFIDDGVYHVTFNAITDPLWFLYSVNFTLKIGDVVFPPRGIVPVPVAHVSFMSNNSIFLGGFNDYFRTASDVTSNQNVNSTVDIWEAIKNETWTNRINTLNTSTDSRINTLNASSLVNGSDAQFNRLNSTGNATFETNVTFRGYASCNLDTDANGILVCGTDASASIDTNDLDIVNTSIFQNSSIIRQGNTSWITENQNTNSSIDIWEALVNESWTSRINTLNGTIIDANDLDIVNTTMLQNSSIIRQGNRSWFNDSILWENLTGETKLKSPQDVNMQKGNINNASNVTINNTLNINEIVISSRSNNNLWNEIFSTDNPMEPLNNLVAVIESNGTTGVIMPHLWIQGGGAGQASGISRSFMIVNENASLQNTTNITSCATVQDKLGVQDEFRVDCNTSTTGADLIVGDDVLIGGDVSLTDSVGEYHSLNRLLQVLDQFFNNLLFSRINASIDGTNLNITDIFGETLVLALNATATNLNRLNDNITLNTGTLTSPAFNYVSYQDQDNPVLTIGSSVPADTVDHADVVRAYIGVDTSQVYLFEDITSHGFNALDHIYDRFDDEGAIYKSGLGISSSATDLNLSTGSVRLRIAQIDYANNVSSRSDFYFINTTGNFINDTSNAIFTNYGDDQSIGNNKYFNIIWGVVPIDNSNMRLVVVIQNKPSTEYGSLSAAEADQFNSIEFFPNNDNVKKSFVPVARTIIQNAGSLDFETLSNGLFHIDIRGKVTASGGSAPAPPITDHPDLDLLDFASAGHTGFVSIVGLVNGSIVRQDNTSWITENQNVNSSVDIWEAIINESWTNWINTLNTTFGNRIDTLNASSLVNSSDAQFNRLNVTRNATFETNVTFRGFSSCNLDTDANGILVCGSDASASIDTNDLDIANVTMLQNSSIIRQGNTSWITENQNTNSSVDIWEALVNETWTSRINTLNATSISHIINSTDAVFRYLNVTTNLTIANSTGLGSVFAGIWNNGSGICISAC